MLNHSPHTLFFLLLARLLPTNIYISSICPPSFTDIMSLPNTNIMDFGGELLSFLLSGSLARHLIYRGNHC
jgi:hypothetical protein